MILLNIVIEKIGKIRFVWVIRELCKDVSGKIVGLLEAVGHAFDGITYDIVCTF